MTIKVGEKEYSLDGYSNHSELQKVMIEIYQQGIEKFHLSRRRRVRKATSSSAEGYRFANTVTELGADRYYLD